MNAETPIDLPSSAAAAALLRLPSGRHYGASASGDCWVMVGRDLRDVESWSIIPPAASLTLAWGAGGCVVAFEGGSLELRRGAAMWMDAGCVHRGENLSGSDFLTLFVAPSRLVATPLANAGIGAAARHAPASAADVLQGLTSHLLAGTCSRPLEAASLDVLLDWAAQAFAGMRVAPEDDDPVTRAASALRDPRSLCSILEIAQQVGLSAPELSRRFRTRYHITPKLFRKQVRLASATRELAGGASVTDAAHDAGFADAAHFSRTFHAQYAVSPSAWARMFRAARA